MKRGLFLIAALLGITQIWAYTCKVNLICYDLHFNDHTATVTYSGQPYNNDYTGHYGGSGLKGLDIQIPTTISYNGEEYTVTAIGDKAFYDCESAILIASITIPSTVTSIGDQAFYRCTSLTSLDIPNSVTSIGSSAFLYSGIYANSSDGVFYVDNWICGHKGSQPLGNLVLNSGTRGISNSAFYACHDLTSVTIPNTVTSIGDNAFSYCSNLTSIKVESGNTKYDSRNDCNSIIEAASNTLIVGCQNTVIPNSVTSIRDNAFYGCSGLTSITIPNSVTSIGESAFYGCSSLTSITITNSVTSIGESAFYGCSGLTSITIPNSITSISNKAFYECSGLTKGIIPNSVTSIGNAAFYGCGLTGITIPNSVTSIGFSAFTNCRNLTSVTIPNSVTSIGDQAFYGCSSLTSVTAEMETPVSITQYTFSNRTNATLYVPYRCKAAYEAADYWNEFKEIVEMSNDEPEDIEVTDISQMDNVIYIEPTEERTGTEATISFKMKNTAAIRGFQFDLVLPEGVTPVEEEGEYVYWLNADRAPKKAGGQFYHTLEVTKQADGSYRFLCGAQADKTFKGNDGEVAVMKVNIADDMKEGDYPIILRNIKLTETDISNYYQTDEVITKLTVVTYIPGDISGDGIVDVSDYIGVANHILGNTPAGFNARAADVNNDNVIDVSDYIGIANNILTGSIYGNNNAAARLMDKEGEQDPQ